MYSLAETSDGASLFPAMIIQAINPNASNYLKDETAFFDFEEIYVSFDCSSNSYTSDLHDYPKS